MERADFSAQRVLIVAAKTHSMSLLRSIMGVLGIGFLNFLVSFTLAFIVAVKSRGVRLNAYPEFLGILWRYFRKNPLDFVRARKRLQEAE